MNGSAGFASSRGLRSSGRKPRDRFQSLGIAFIAGLGVAIGGSVGLATATDQPKALDPPAMQALVAEALKVWEVPGVAVAVVSRDDVLWLHGHGVRDLNTQQRLAHTTLFPLASCTKAFTATLIGMLQDDGKLTWDDPVHKHLPTFRLADACASESATFRDLLCHRTGLAAHDYLWYRAPWPPEDAVRRAGLLSLEKPFRTAFQYQSTMVTAAGLAAARAAGSGWELLVRDRIFQPLGMRGARCTSPPADADRASPHRLDRSGVLRVIPWYEQLTADPAGSIHASADDLVPWLQFHLGDGVWRGRRLLSAAGLREMQTPQIALRLEGLHRAAAPDTLLMSYGLGWVIHDYRGQLVISHAGAIDGFRAHITLLPNAGLGFALLCNRHQSRMNLALSNTLIDRLLGLPPRDWHAYYRNFARQEDELSAAAHKRPGHAESRPSRPASDLVGRFAHPAYGVIAIAKENGVVVFQWSGFRGTVRDCGDDDFTVDDENLTDNSFRPIVSENRVVALEFLNLRFDRQ